MIRIELGKVGFGNQLFIYAAANAIAKQKKNIQIVNSLNDDESILTLSRNIEDSLRLDKPRKYSLHNLYLFTKTRFPKRLKLIQKIFLVQKSETLSPTQPKSIRSRTKIIEGYFQDIDWLRIESKALKTIINSYPESTNFQKYVAKRGEKVLGIHVRHGDYLHLRESFGVLDLQYYKNALEKIRHQEFERILVFSDDIEWCKENFGFMSNTQFIGEDIIKSPIENHKMLGNCQAIICANSSFSISAAAIFDPNLVVVPTSIYFDKTINETLTSSYSDSWVKVESIWSSPK